jgi:hypothetical protein
MRIDSAGNLALGITSGYRTAAGYVAFAINGTSGSLIDLYASGTRYGGIAATQYGTYVSSITAIPLIFATTDIERMRIDASGAVGIGTSTPSAKLNVVGGVVFQNTTLEFGAVSTTANQFVLQYMASGNGYYSYMGVNGAAAGVIDINGNT